MQKQFITETPQTLPVMGEYDVVVVGGGIAGIAAALAASRVKGTKVCLIEKVCVFGGLATVGNVIVYLPLCDGKGHQVIGGIGEELLRLSVENMPEITNPFLKYEAIPPCWNDPNATVEERSQKRFRTAFNPITYLYQLEHLMLKNRIKFYFDMRFCNVVKENNRITAVIVESKSGRTAIQCKTVVDCSGDADVCAMAGEKTFSAKDNVRCGWFYYFNGTGPVKLNVCSDKLRTKKNLESGTCAPYAFRGDTADSVTKQVLESRNLMMERLATIREKEGGNPEIINSVSIPTFRMSRRIVGKVTLKETDDHHWFNDTVAMTGDWRKAGPIFAIPMRALAAPKTGNLITAGRCFASAGDTWDCCRVIPTCAVTGEAAGAAAALLSHDEPNASFLEMDIPSLQKYLRRKGNIIDKSLIDNTL